jgi:succinate-semialdehyde dehydrogenase / glutarate-semialdehyde dehydrogenase
MSPTDERTLWIGGQWRAAADGRRFASRDPSTGAVLGEAADAGAADMRLAIDAADAAFEGWARTPAARRARWLHAIADRLAARRDEVVLAVCREQGKTRAEAARELDQAEAFFRWFAEEGRRACGQVIPDPLPDRRLLTLREPVGVTAAITPWNIPAAAFARKVAPALAAGCTVVFKPAEQTPLVAVLMARIAQEADLPPGVVNLVTTRDAPAFGEVIARDERVRKIAFTGSTEVGRILLRQSAETVKRTSMELGGNAPVIVLADADLDRTLDQLVALKFRNAGQACISANRIYVQSDVAQVLAQRLAARADALRVGPGPDPASDMGPLVEQAAVAKVERLLADALARGARLLAGGSRPGDGELASGCFFRPTVLVQASPQMALHGEEIFGPVASVYTFDRPEQALAAANATPWGLGAYVFTRDLARGLRFAEGLRAGMVGINDQRISAVEAPFGGVQASGMGREGGVGGLDDYLQTKLIAIGLPD